MEKNNNDFNENNGLNNQDSMAQKPNDHNSNLDSFNDRLRNNQGLNNMDNRPDKNSRNSEFQDKDSLSKAEPKTLNSKNNENGNSSANDIAGDTKEKPDFVKQGKSVAPDQKFGDDFSKPGTNNSNDKNGFGNAIDNLKNIDMKELGGNIKKVASQPRKSYVKFRNNFAETIADKTKNSKLPINKVVASKAINTVMTSSVILSSLTMFGIFFTDHKKVFNPDGACLTQNTGDTHYLGSVGIDGSMGDWTQEGTKENDTAKKVLDMLKGMGWSGPAIAGIMGNMAAESGFRIQAVNKKADGSSDGGTGLIQWTFERQQGLVKLAKDMGKSEYDLDVQLKQLELDLKNPAMWTSNYTHNFSPTYYNSLKDPKEAAMRFYISSFVSGGKYDHDPNGSGTKRTAGAQEAYSLFNLAEIKGDDSKIKSLLGGENQSTANVNSAIAESINNIMCDVSTEHGDTSSIVSTAQSLKNYFTYSMDARTNFAKSGAYNKVSKLSDVDKNGNADCSSYVWLVLKLAGYNVPDQCWNTPAMESDAKGDHKYLKEIDEKQAKAGDIVIVNKNGGDGSNGHTAILLEDWHGTDTRVINEGGSQPNGSVHEGKFSTEFYPSLQGGVHTFATPVKK